MARTRIPRTSKELKKYVGKVLVRRYFCGNALSVSVPINEKDMDEMLVYVDRIGLKYAYVRYIGSWKNCKEGEFVVALRCNSENADIDEREQYFLPDADELAAFVSKELKTIQEARDNLVWQISFMDASEKLLKSRRI